MSVFTYHLVKISYFKAISAMFFPPKPNNIKGLIHAECMTSMTLGSSIYSPSRFLIRQIAVFAQWEDESAINDFLENDSFGKTLAKGWHTRLLFLRQWGGISGFIIPNQNTENNSPNLPVVAVTIARMKFLAIPRFIRWGRPVEQQVRDHTGTILSLASIRLPRTVSTFSIWKSQKEMIDMVHGHSAMPKPKRHSNAMKERDRKDFHYEFTTLRFKPILEFGEWNGKSNFIPKLKKIK
tara:strand:- start:66885 stop:67598 length:714 start_codon:yes stop_codon:yes gene_type:complete